MYTTKMVLAVVQKGIRRGRSKMIIAAAGTKILPAANYLFNLPINNKIKRKSISITPKAKKRENSSTEQSSELRSSTSKLLIQSAITLFGLGFVDAGYSGDWSRIGAISKDTEEVLKIWAFGVVPLCIFLIYSLSNAKQKDM